MTTRDIRAHLREMYVVDVSPDLISRVTDGVLEELAEWQSRPLDSEASTRWSSSTSLRYASRKYWVPLAKDLRPIYTAADEAAALEAFAGHRGGGAR